MPEDRKLAAQIVALPLLRICADPYFGGMGGLRLMFYWRGPGGELVAELIRDLCEFGGYGEDLRYTAALGLARYLLAHSAPTAIAHLIGAE